MRLKSRRLHQSAIGLSALVVGLAALFQAAVLVWSIRSEAGVSADSTQYLTVAENLLAGNGLTTLWWSGHPEPLTHFPPLFPVLLAALAAFGGTPAGAAYVMNVFLAAANVLLVAILAQRSARHLGVNLSALAAALGATLACISNNLLLTLAMVWSEPLFIAFTLVALIALGEVLGGHRVWRAYTLMVLAAGAATLTRFVGVALVCAIGVSLLMLSEGPWRARLRRSLLVGVAALLPMLLWAAINSMRGHSAANRHLALHLVRPAELANGLATLVGWVVPHALGGVARVVITTAYAVAILLLAGVAVGAAKTPPVGGRGRASSAMRRVLAAFVVTYVGFVIVSISVADRSTRLDARILSPVLAVSLALAVSFATSALAWFAAQPPRRRIVGRTALASLVAVYVAAQVAGIQVWSARARTRGLGLVRVQRRYPELFSRIRALPHDAHIYSNMPFIVNYVDERTATGIPMRYSPTSMRPNEQLASELEALGQAADDGNAYIVTFDLGLNQSYLAPPAMLGQYARSDSVEAMDGGRIEHVVPP